MITRIQRHKKEIVLLTVAFVVLIATFMSGNLSACYQIEKKYVYSVFFILGIISIIVYYVMRKIYKYVSVNEEVTKSFKEKSDELEKALSEKEEQEEILREQAVIFDSIQDSIMLHDLEGKFLYLNENAWKTRGYTYEEMMGMTIKDVNAPETEKGDPQKLKAAAEKMKTDGYVRIQAKHLCKNGDRIDVEVYAKLITYHGQPCILKSIRDITKQVQAQMEIKKLSIAMEQIDDSVMITDTGGVITYVNKAFCDHTEYLKEELLGSTPKLFKSYQHDNAFYENLWKTILKGKVYRRTLVNKKKNGDIFYEDKTITPLKDDKEKIVGFVSTGKDVTKEMLMRQEIEHIAMIDQLTGIYNRHKFEQMLVLEVERSRRFGQQLSLILIDIDHFKSVNDTYGHDIGDEVIICLVKIIQENIRKLDIFARWGGEEFLILSPDTDLDKVQALAEKLRLAVEKADFPKVSHITISQGVGMFEKEDTFDAVFKRVDQGLYYAKEHGRNQVGVVKNMT